MSNNVESLHSKKIRIESMTVRLNKNCENISGLSVAEKEQRAALLETLATNLNLIKEGIKIGILKKIEIMDLETLQSIAIRSLSIFSEGINPDAFISEYERLKNKQKTDLEEFEKGQKEELKKRRELAPSLEYELRGPAYAFVDVNGNPRTNLIIEDKQLEILKAQVKKDPNTRKIFKVKVPKDFFTDDELLKLGPKYHNGVSENVEVLKPIHLSKEEMHELYPIISQRHAAFLSFVKIRPENALLSEEELRDKYQQDLCRFQFIIKITPDIRRKERFDYKYHSSAKPQENLQINQMGIVLPEMTEKQKLLSDTAHLKRYVQELLVGSEFLNWFSSVDADNPTYQQLQQLKASPLETFFSEEEFNSIINPIILAKSAANAQQLFSDSKNIDRYRDYLKRVKKENEKQIKQPCPKLWLRASNLTEEEINIISNATIFSQTFYSRKEAYASGLISILGVITEEDLNMLEQNQLITKEIDGRIISFGLDYGRTKGMSKYSDERKRQSSDFYEDLKRTITDYRSALSSYYQQFNMINFCDKQLQVLKELEQKLPRPISQGSFNL